MWGRLLLRTSAAKIDSRRDFEEVQKRDLQIIAFVYPNSIRHFQEGVDWFARTAGIEVAMSVTGFQDFLPSPRQFAHMQNEFRERAQFCVPHCNLWFTRTQRAQCIYHFSGNR